MNDKVRCIVLGEVTEAHIDQITRLYRAEGWWQPGDNAKKELIPRLVAGSHCFVIALAGSEMVGMGRAISDGISDAYIQDLVVHSNHRKQGIGKLILRTLLERLHADGIAWIGLIAEPGSDPLYRHAGFREMSGSTPMLMFEER
jgi:ribosomal protein S18 acetylase RimI-like enzyme